MEQKTLYQKIEKFVKELQKDPRVKGFQYSCKYSGGVFGGSWETEEEGIDKVKKGVKALRRLRSRN